MVDGLARLVALGLLLVPLAAHAEVPKTEEERTAAMRTLDWKRGGGSFHLDGSSSTLVVDPKHITLLGADARRFFELSNGVAPAAGLEAMVIDPGSDSVVSLLSTREGYVRFDDWSDVDADAMLTDIKDGTAEANKKRAALGMGALSVVGWRQKPTLDKTQQTVSWAIEGRAGGEPLVNAVLLTFGRHGYEKLTWIGPGQLDPAPMLNQVRDNFRFDAGAQYADFRDGDKVAEYGIAALVATAVGAKVATKFGLIAMAALFLKKGWVVVIAVGAGLWGWLRKRAGGKAGPST